MTTKERFVEYLKFKALVKQPLKSQLVYHVEPLLRKLGSTQTP